MRMGAWSMAGVLRQRIEYYYFCSLHIIACHVEIQESYGVL